MTIKDTRGKLNPALIPFRAVESIVKVREFGNKKYTPDSFYQVEPRLLVDAAFRHIMTVLKEDYISELDPESGLMHLEHALCSVAGAVEIIKRLRESMVSKVMYGGLNPDGTIADKCKIIKENS